MMTYGRCAILFRFVAAGSAALLLSSAAIAQGAGPGATPPLACDNTCVRTNADRAVQACAPRIEAEAPGDFDWLFRPYGGIFQEADTPEQPTSSVVRYRGDSIRFLSPQKEWVRSIYECGFDAAKQQVAYVRVRLGVLGKASAVPVLPGPQAGSAGRPGAPQAGMAPAAAAPAAATPAPVNLRLIGEPSEVDVRQVSPRSRPTQ